MTRSGMSGIAKNVPKKNQQKAKIQKEKSQREKIKEGKIKKRRRLNVDVRAEQILKGAISFFAEHGFGGQTRELTARLGVSKGLLYRYFPSKKILIDKVYEEVFLRRWNPEWEKILSDRERPLIFRLKLFYSDYSKLLREYEWVRIYIYSGLAKASINRRYVELVINRIYKRIIDELRHEFGYPSLEMIEATEPELEMMWNMHGALFYIGVRRWVYDLEVSSDIDGAVERVVDGLYSNMEEVMRRSVQKE